MLALLLRGAATTIVVGVALTAAVACAPGARPAGNVSAPRFSTQAISAQEITAVSSSTAYDAVKRLRPMWLLGNRGGGMPLVYVDNLWRGGFEELYRISTIEIEDIQLIRGYDATTRWGTGHGAGVILVTTRR
jgi:hypothetical protein